MLNSVYAVIRSKYIEDTCRFYEQHFKFERSFSTDWYVNLKSGEYELAVLDPDHPSIPDKFRGRTNGAESLLNFEIDDVDAAYREFTESRRPIHLELRDEPWGQRHFISEDPNGIAIDVIEIIPPSAEFLAHYSE